MDAFAIACGSMGISPRYFWDTMDFSEFEAIGQAYRETWEKARLTLLALGGNFPLPWDVEANPVKYKAPQRAALSNQLKNILNGKKSK